MGVDTITAASRGPGRDDDLCRNGSEVHRGSRAVTSTGPSITFRALVLARSHGRQPTVWQRFAAPPKGWCLCHIGRASFFCRRRTLCRATRVVPVQSSRSWAPVSRRRYGLLQPCSLRAVSRIPFFIRPSTRLAVPALFGRGITLAACKTLESRPRRNQAYAAGRICAHRRVYSAR